MKLTRNQQLLSILLKGGWYTLSDLATKTGYPEASVSAGLRILRTASMGSHKIRKMRESQPVWCYSLDQSGICMEQFFKIVHTPAAMRDSPAEPITCKDGTVISIQASRDHYSTPRSDNANLYTSVEISSEIAFPELRMYLISRAEQQFLIYGWVPTELATIVLMMHGGEA